MKAIRIQSPRVVEICELPMPEPKEDEALLKPLYGGICGSDLNSFRGTMAYFSYPRVPGHEFSAEIVQIGPNDRGFKAGDVVICNPYFNCGKCFTCRKGMVNVCMDNQTMGVQREGAFAEYITMPVSRLIDGKGLPAKTLALIEPFCIGQHGIERAQVKAGDRVLVVGAGAIGLFAAIAAKAKGAEVYVADIAPKKLDYAMRFGLAGTILNDSKEHFDAEVRRITDGDGFDVTVEAVGLPSTFQDCLDAAAFSGRVSVIGVGKHNIDLNFTIIQKKELNVYGSRNALTVDFETLVDTILNQGLKLDDVITNIYPFSEAQKAFEDFDRCSGDMLKVLIDFSK